MRIEHLMRIGVSQVLQSMAAGMRHEFVKVHRVVDRGEIVVEQPGVRQLEQSGNFALQKRTPDLREPGRRCHELQAPAGLPQTLPAVLNVSGVKQHEFPQKLTNVVAGEDVVADEGDPIARQAFLAHAQQGVANLGRAPRNRRRAPAM